MPVVNEPDQPQQTAGAAGAAETREPQPPNEEEAVAETRTAPGPQLPSEAAEGVVTQTVHELPPHSAAR